MKKIKVKDYYAVIRGRKRAEILPEEKRLQIAKNANKKRWKTIKKVK